MERQNSLSALNDGVDEQGEPVIFDIGPEYKAERESSSPRADEKPKKAKYKIKNGDPVLVPVDMKSQKSSPLLT